METDGFPCDFSGARYPAWLVGRCSILPEDKSRQTELYLHLKPGTQAYDGALAQYQKFQAQRCDLERAVGRKTWPDGITETEYQKLCTQESAN